MNLIDHKVKEANCPHCKKKINGATGNTVKPMPGDLSICINCCGLSCFNEDGSLREPTIDERFKALEAPYIRKAIAAVKHVKECVGKP